MDNACTPDNVAGKLTGQAAYEGKPVDLEAVQSLDNSGRGHFVDTQNSIHADVFKASHPTSPEQQLKYAADEHALSVYAGGGDNGHGGGSGGGGGRGPGPGGAGASPEPGFLKYAVNAATSFVNEYRNWSGIFGEDFVKPVVDFASNHFEKHNADLWTPEAKSEYFSGMQQVFDRLDTQAQFDSPAVQKSYEQFKSDYLGGGDFYNPHSEMGVIQGGLSNLISNTVKSSPHAILGHAAAAMVKFPALYPKQMLGGLAEAWKHGLWAHDPELAAKGIYGKDFVSNQVRPRDEHGLVSRIPVIGSTLSKKWEGLLWVSDVPIKNWAYRTGELHPDGGQLAVQKVAFATRFGDTPHAYFSAGGKAPVQLLGYTINHYKMITKMVRDFPHNPAPLLTYAVLSSVIGGGMTAAVPSALVSLAEAIDPDSKQWFDDNSGYLTDLVQAKAITGIGLPYTIATQDVGRSLKLLKDARDAFVDGDAKSGTLNTAEGILSFLPFMTRGVGGDAKIQKVLDIARQWAEGSIDTADVPITAVQKLAPFLEVK